MDLFLLIIVAILFIGLVVYLYRYNSSSYKGKAGEALVHNILMELPDEYYVMDDVVMNTVRGTTQIDHIVISKYGVFVIETKNYSGSIFGNDENKKWTQRNLVSLFSKDATLENSLRPYIETGQELKLLFSQFNFRCSRLR